MAYSRRQSILILASANLVFLLLLCALVEGVLRLGFDSRFGPRPDFEVPDSGLVWTNNRNLNHTYFGSDFSMHITTDERGNRLDSRGAPGPEDRLIVLVGDSYTFGWGVSDDETFAAYLDKSLPAGFRVVNLGVPGYGPLAEADRLVAYLGSIDTRRVEAIVVLHADNDPVDNVMYLLLQTGFEVHHSGAQSMHSPLRLVNLLGHVWSKLVRATEPALPQTGALVWRGQNFGSTDPASRLAETDVPASKSRSHLTPLQRRLYAMALQELDQALPSVPVHHFLLFIDDHTATYGPAIEEAVAGNHPRHWHGILPMRNWPTQQPVHNLHSGGHFTPAYNRYVGEILRRALFP